VIPVISSTAVWDLPVHLYKTNISLQNIRDAVTGYTPQVGGNQDIGSEAAVAFGDTHFFKNVDGGFPQVLFRTLMVSFSLI